MTIVNIDLDRIRGLQDIENWYNDLQPAYYNLLPGGKAVVLTDMINGFTHEGPLASDRVKALVPGIVALCDRIYPGGLYVSIQDAHRHNALEFNSFPPHAVRGTKEAELAPEFAEYPWVVFEKDTLNPAVASAALDNQLLGWTEKRNPTQNAVTKYTEVFFVVGNCTDLCVYQTAMHLRQFFNATGRNNSRVIVPANLVATYDLRIGERALGNHDGDFFQKVFLYHMALNGVEVVKEIVL